MTGDVAVALSVITYVGLIISLFCLSLFIVTYLSEKYVIYQLPLRSIVSTSTFIIFRKLRTNIHGQILVNMSLALIGLYVFFLTGGHVTSIQSYVVSAQLCCSISSLLSLDGQLLKQCGSTSNWSKSLEQVHSHRNSLSSQVFLHGVSICYRVSSRNFWLGRNWAWHFHVQYPHKTLILNFVVFR